MSSSLSFKISRILINTCARTVFEKPSVPASFGQRVILPSNSFNCAHIICKLRDFFKHRFGFVNVDDANLYFTNSGNWSETLGLQEMGLQRQKTWKKARISAFLMVLAVLAGIQFLSNLGSGNLSKLLLALPFGVYGVYHYLKPELGAQFKLPLSRITEIRIDHRNASFTFSNAHNHVKTYEIEGLDEKGLNILHALNILLFDQSEL